MVKDYVLFMHGVNTREEDPAQPQYAKILIDNIEAEIASAARGQQFDFKPIVFYWGDLAQKQEDKLLEMYNENPDTWSQFWFRSIRETVLLQFIGDSALYISRYVGAQLVEKLKEQLAFELNECQTGDRLHLVSHSLGTIILFDLLFSSRWDPQVLGQEVPGQESVRWIRNVLYGVKPNPLQGNLVTASVTTMASSLSLFSLMDVDFSVTNRPYATHDVTPRLQVFLQDLALLRKGTPLPWLNFAHPGDPFAYPLDPLLYEMVDIQRKNLTIRDYVKELLSPEEELLTPIERDAILGPMVQEGIALANIVNAHGGYWANKKVAEVIVQTIIASAQ